MVFMPSLPRSPLVFYHDFKRLRFKKEPLVSCARSIYAREKIPASRKTHVILCSDYRIRKLNAMFRHKDRATDVLSFNFDENDLLGEIYISLERTAVQARRYKDTYDNELKRLLVHGMYHLLGYDHEAPADQKKMRKKESFYCP
jgi:probable rRNA maturation factor